MRMRTCACGRVLFALRRTKNASLVHVGGSVAQAPVPSVGVGTESRELAHRLLHLALIQVWERQTTWREREKQTTWRERNHASRKVRTLPSSHHT